MNTKKILTLSAALVLLSSANATYIFTEDFESYTVGDPLGSQGGWTSASSYVLHSDSFTPDGSELLAGNTVANGSLSTTFSAQTDTVFIGVDLDYSISSSNFFLFGLSNGASDANTAAAIFGASSSTPVVTARAFADSGYSAGSAATYGDSSGWDTDVTRLIMEVSKSVSSGNYDTVIITDVTGSIVSTIVGDLGTDTLDTIYARMGGTGGGRMRLDNISVATTFAEAVTIPEPSTFALLAGVGVLTAAASRRRKR